LVHTDQVSINAPAQYFGKKIIDGDSANQWFTGGDSTRHALGNLHAGDTSEHMQKLIDKWFLGKDHPMAKSSDRSTTYDYEDTANELWVALAEKAYAQFNESGWLGLDGTNSYNGIGGAIDPDDNYSGLNGEFSADALNRLTGSGTSGGSTGGSTYADVKAAFNAGKAVVFSSRLDPVSDDVVAGPHGYMMTGYDGTHHTITLRNPWGDGYDQPAEVTG